jgi:hypothetical protein
MWFVIVISSFEVGGPASSARRGRVVSWYEVYSSPAVCYWREPTVSRGFGP